MAERESVGKGSGNFVGTVVCVEDLNSTINALVTKIMAQGFSAPPGR